MHACTQTSSRKPVSMRLYAQTHACMHAVLKLYAKLEGFQIPGYIFEEYVARHILPKGGGHKGEVNLFLLALNNISTDRSSRLGILPDDICSSFRSRVQQHLVDISVPLGPAFRLGVQGGKLDTVEDLIQYLRNAISR
jgi:hypothetical protein